MILDNWVYSFNLIAVESIGSSASSHCGLMRWDHVNGVDVSEQQP
jgi:hypothetical protein